MKKIRRNITNKTWSYLGINKKKKDKHSHSISIRAQTEVLRTGEFFFLFLVHLDNRQQTLSEEERGNPAEVKILNVIFTTVVFFDIQWSLVMDSQKGNYWYKRYKSIA